MKDNHRKYFEIVGVNIKSARQSQGLSQQKLADRCEKVDRAKISDIENAKEDFMVSTLIELCEALSTNLSEITKGTDL